MVHLLLLLKLLTNTECLWLNVRAYIWYARQDVTLSFELVIANLWSFIDQDNAFWGRVRILVLVQPLLLCSSFIVIRDTKRNSVLTRMHSSRMRTAHLLPVSPSMHYGGGSALGVSAPRVGVYFQGGVCWWGVSASGPRGCVSQHAIGQTPPCGQTDNCGNITFANFVCGRK